MSQVALDDVIDGCQRVILQRSNDIKKQVWEVLTASGIDPDGVNGLESIFESEYNPFSGLETKYKQEKYFQEQLGLVVSFMILLGEEGGGGEFSSINNRPIVTLQTKGYRAVIMTLLKII